MDQEKVVHECLYSALKVNARPTFAASSSLIWVLGCGILLSPFCITSFGLSHKIPVKYIISQGFNVVNVWKGSRGMNSSERHCTGGARTNHLRERAAGPQVRWLTTVVLCIDVNGDSYCLWDLESFPSLKEDQRRPLQAWSSFSWLHQMKFCKQPCQKHLSTIQTQFQTSLMGLGYKSASE